MKTLELKKEPSSLPQELYTSDLVELSNGIAPGAWVSFTYKNSFKGIGFVNPKTKKGPVGYIISTEKKDPLSIITDKLQRAFNYRKKFSHLNDGGRLFYGVMDGLPGLIIDEYKNLVVVQINTAGLDNYREDIRTYLKNEKAKTVILLDNEKYRENEGLPKFEENLKDLPDIQISENGINYICNKASFQKLGYYYDHRVCRERMQRKLEQMNMKFESGLDLFSYLGSWGLHLLKSGVNNVDFVDQAPLDENTHINLEMNGYSERGKFYRLNIFNDDLSEKLKKKYDVIVSDPPALAKSANEKKAALIGYNKILKKVSPLLNNEAVLVFASCTSYVSLQELSDLVANYFKNTHKTCRLIDIGIQGEDHPISGLNDKHNYIKFLMFYIGQEA
jgi:23S rRNA (cytosine1962-C5)-methyltransferase